MTNLIPINPSRSRVRVLWITPRWPLPESDGARVATAQSLATLAADGRFEVSVLAILGLEDLVDANPLNLAERWGVQDTRALARADRVLGSKLLSWILRLLFHSSQAVTFLPLGSKEIREKATEWIGRENFDALVFDGLHGAMIYESAGKVNLPSIPTLYRAHNVEADLWRMTSERTRNWFMRKVLEAQHFWVDRFERSLVEKSTRVLAVSDEDLAQFKNRMAYQKSPKSVVVYRIGAEFGENGPIARSLDGKLKLGFIGKLDWRPNKEGLEWLLKEVWPAAKKLRPELSLQIAGHPKLTSPLPEGVESLGYVSDLAGFYAGIDALLVPIFTGSGTRVKVIEASRYSRACIGTSVGLSGVPLVTSIVVDTRDAWIEILMCVQAKDLAFKGQAAWFAAREKFESQKCGDVLIESLLEATGRPQNSL